MYIVYVVVVLDKTTPFFRKFSCQRLISEFSEEFEKQISKFFCLTYKYLREKTTKKCQITPFSKTLEHLSKDTIFGIQPYKL